MKKILLAILLIFFVIGCSTKRDIVYLNKSSEILEQYEYKDFIIQADDILNIKVMTMLPELSLKYNPISDNMFNTIEGAKMQGYLVDNLGYITFPVLGKINLMGLSINEAQNKIYELLLESGNLINHTVIIKSINNHFTVLGEVLRPGVYQFFDNNINIFEAIGMAGDLTINGIRTDIKIIRKINDTNKVYSFDLTDDEILSSDLFQVLNNDIIIVNPNTSRIKNAGIIGNAGNLLSLLSFLLSTIIVINN